MTHFSSCLSSLLLMVWTLSALATSASGQDECATAILIPTDGTVITSNLSGATASPEPNCLDPNPVVDVWYTFVPAESGRAVLTLTEPLGILLAAAEAYEGDCGSLTSLACQLNFLFQMTTTTTIDVVAGRTYYYRHLMREASLIEFSVALTPDISDDCIGAFTLLENQPFAFDTTAATPSSPDFSCSKPGGSPTSPDLWFLFSTSSPGAFSASTCGTANFDTRIEVYSADPFTSICDTLVSVACSEDGTGCSGGTSEAIFSSAGSGTFVVRVGGSDGSAFGTGDLVVNRLLTTPANDNCADAQVVTEGSTAFSSEGATPSGTAMSCAPAGDSGDGRDVWFEFVPTNTCLVQIDTLGSSYDTIVEVYRGCNGQRVECGDDFEGSPQGGVVFFAFAGVTHNIQVGSVAGAFGAGMLNVTERPGGVANLLCEGVPNSTGLPGTLCALGSAVAMDNDLLFSFTQLPPTTTCLLINSESATLVMNPGGSAGNLCIASFAVGRQAMFMSDGIGGAGYTLDLTVTPTPSGNRSIMAGETWYWQVWHRDVDAMTSNPTSNFTNAVELTFQ